MDLYLKKDMTFWWWDDVKNLQIADFWASLIQKTVSIAG